MIPTPRICSFITAIFSSVIFAVSAHASLLTASNETQLEAWLGQGNLDFANTFTKVQGNTAADFHAAADGKGATFSLMRISIDNWETSQIIGGYNPQSWSLSDSYNKTSNDADRTAFIFNLTDGVIQRQNLIGQGDLNFGEYQTFNTSVYGPAFGYNYDLQTNPGLDYGYAANHSYGGTSYGQEIVSGPANNVAVDPKFTSYSFEIHDLEVYTFAPSQTRGGGNSVPDTTSTITLVGGAMIGLAALRRRFVG